jgi:Na+/H+-dicarboxylate symporter
MKGTIAVLVALILGLALGTAVGAADNPSLERAVTLFGALGTAWINAIQMTVIPLVASLAVTSVASAGSAGNVGRLGGLAVLTFTVLLVAGGVFAMLVAPFSIDRLAFGPDAVAQMQAAAGAAPAQPAQMPSMIDRLIEMIPRNPVASAVAGSVLPVVVFSILMGVAALRIEERHREVFLNLFRSVIDIMLTIVGWVLRIAPLGVFALALVLGMRIGVQSAPALVQYIVTLSAVLFVFTLLLYPLAAIVGRVSPLTFASAVLPAQSIAFSARSSLASLPAQIAGARHTLKLSSTSTGFVLPLAVSVFRVNVPIAWVVGVLFLGKLYGIPVTEGQLIMLVITSTLISFSVPGIPSASLFLLAPVLVQNGLPPEGVGILIAVDAIPDMFKTLANVTAHMTSATILARAEAAPTNGGSAGI